MQRRLHDLAAWFRDRTLAQWGSAHAQRRLSRPRNGRPHTLPRELIISLTSYPARFGTLHLTLACLLDQTVAPDRIILWVAQNDFGALPRRVRDLEQRGLEVRACDDIRSFKKLLPALKAFPDAYIATADDDVYYPNDWLEILINACSDRVIACHRAHRIKRRSDGRVAPYLEWDFIVQVENSQRPSSDLVPTGVGGVLYPPQSLDPCVSDRQLFQRLSPDGDDLWFFWCGRLTGTLTRKGAGRMRKITWVGSQDAALWDQNKQGGNDRAIRALEEEFGPLP
jgi:hypothetical protein